MKYADIKRNKLKLITTIYIHSSTQIQIVILENEKIYNKNSCKLYLNKNIFNETFTIDRTDKNISKIIFLFWEGIKSYLFLYIISLTIYFLCQSRLKVNYILYHILYDWIRFFMDYITTLMKICYPIKKMTLK